MNNHDLHKKKMMDEISVNDFTKLNGTIMRTVGTFSHPWFKGSNLKIALNKDDVEIYQSLDYLQQCGFIKVRVIDTKEEVEVYDFDLEEIEVRPSADGIKLLNFKKKDELIEI